MGIYYTAKRSVPMNKAEDAKITEITDRYYRQYTLSKNYEGPGRFTYDKDYIYDGMIRLPMDIPTENMEAFLSYWLKWLTDITRVLQGAEWETNFEDVPLIWEEKTGWRLMSDQEYHEFNKK